MSRQSSCSTILALLTVLAGCLHAADPTLEDVGIKPVAPAKDARTGFVVGGKNPTASIRKLTEIAGRPIADLEKDMRPGAVGAGFLGKDERLLDIMAADNVYVVDDRGLSHQELARHLHVLGALAVKESPDAQEIAYRDRKFRIKAECFRGFQDSPFRDGTKTNCNATIENLGNGKKLSYSLLVPYMIERYGFYEGKGTSYRVEPKAVLEVFDFLKSRKGG